ncbi:MAG: insulinase family protein [Myxococcales bacterium]|nr:insulinase family protein [Myxococcales bacterium]
MPGAPFVRLALWTILLGALGLAGRAVAQAPDPKIPHTKYRLANGLTVLLAEDHRLPLVSLNLWYAASPANEPAGRSGFAHLFEHMMFQGSQHVGDDQHIKLLEQNGVTLYNGTTDFDRTNYFETLPANRLELGLWMESDRMGFLVATLTRAKLDNQREVVRNERRQSVEETPYGSSEEALVQLLFPESHPYHGNVIGSHEDLARATVADVARFHRDFYSPANATLVLAGDFDPAAARALVARYFGPLKGGKRQPLRTAAPPLLAAQRRVIEDAVTLPRVAFGWVTAPAFTPGDAELDLAASLLGHGRSSRLYKQLVHRKQVASDVDCHRQPLALGSIFTCFATAAPGRRIEEVERALSDELDALRGQKVEKEEIDRARNGLFAHAISQLEQLGGFGGKSDVLQLYQHYLDDPDHLATDFARYRAVTPDALQKAVQAGLADAHRMTVVTVPRKQACPEPCRRARP